MTILETAAAVAATGPLCDHCLGRCFATRSRGLTDEERGRALRIALAPRADEPFDPTPPAECWVCEGLSGEFEAWAERAQAALADISFATYLVGTHVPEAFEEREAALRDQTGRSADECPPMKAEVNREVGKQIGERTGATVDHEAPEVVILIDVDHDEVDIQINPAYTAGRYRKNERGFPQRKRICRVCHGEGVRWEAGKSRPCDHCDGTGIASEESVEQSIADPIVESLSGTEAVFNAAGQEADDVRVLGRGRPFVIEVKEPRQRPPDLAALEAAIASESDEAVTVEGLVETTNDMVQHVAESRTRETYRATVTFDERVAADELQAALDQLDGATVRLHVEDDEGPRERLRTLPAVRGELTDDLEATVEIELTDDLDLRLVLAGTDGRAEPSLADMLGTGVSVDHLDIIAVAGVDGPILEATGPN